MPINLFEFSNTDPGDGKIGLLFSSSRIVGGDPTNYIIQAANVSFNSINNIDVVPSLERITGMTIIQSGSTDFEGSIQKFEFEVSNAARKNQYYFLQFAAIKFFNYSVSDSKFIEEPIEDGDSLLTTLRNIPSGSGNLINRQVFLEPYVTADFTNNDYEALISNATKSETTTFRSVVDKDTSQLVPGNLDAIISGSAAKADLQDSFYETTGLVNARYAGSKITSGSEVGFDPGLSFIQFDASRHEVDADDSTIASINPAERDIQEFFFDVNVGSPVRDDVLPGNRIPNSKLRALPSVSGSGNYVYRFDDLSRRYVRVVDSKLFILDNNAVLTLDEKGFVTSENVVTS